MLCHLTLVGSQVFFLRLPIPTGRCAQSDTETSGSGASGKSGSDILGSGQSAWEKSALLAGAAYVHSGIPSGWPDPRGFIPPPPGSTPPTCWLTDEPVVELTRNYNGANIEFTEALSSYHYFRDDARFWGWQSYLQGSQDFINFCCHMHIWEMFSTRGGAGKTRVVWRWETIR